MGQLQQSRLFAIAAQPATGATGQHSRGRNVGSQGRKLTAKFERPMARVLKPHLVFLDAIRVHAPFGPVVVLIFPQVCTVGLRRPAPGRLSASPDLWHPAIVARQPAGVRYQAVLSSYLIPSNSPVPSGHEEQMNGMRKHCGSLRGCWGV